MTDPMPVHIVDCYDCQDTELLHPGEVRDYLTEHETHKVRSKPLELNGLKIPAEEP